MWWRCGFYWHVFALLLAVTVSVFAQTAPYINAAVADTEFHRITSVDMDLLRTKKILFYSRSFGLNLRAGLASLAAKNPMYNILNSYVNYDIFNAGGNLNVVPVDAFHQYNFVHVMCTPSPYTARLPEFNNLLRDPPHYIADDLEAGMLDNIVPEPDKFSLFTAMMDSLQANFPHIKFIYTTAGLQGATQVGSNNLAAQFNTLVRTKYKGVAPLFDWGFILNNDSACGDHYCPEYSTDPADVHPNTEFAQERVAKGFLLMLYKLYCENQPTCASLDPPTVPTGLSGAGLSLTSTRFAWNASTHAACGVDYYRIRRDGADIGISYGLSYSDHNLIENTPYSYQVAAVSKGAVASAYCSAILVRTLNDSIAPRVLAVPNTIRPTEVVITFSEKLDSVSATTAANYAITGGVTVVSASLLDSVVTLVTSSLPPNAACTLTVNNVADRSRNHHTIAADSRATFKYNSMSIETDMIGYWTFDDTLRDFSGNNNHGTWVGAAAYGPGKRGRALSLDNTAGGGYVTIPDANLLDGMAQVTFALWIRKKTAATGGQALIKHVTYTLDIGSNTMGGYLFNATSARFNYSATVAAVNDTNWHHYCVVYNGATVKGYVDGQVWCTTPMTNTVATTSNGIYVGKNPWGNSFNGSIDEFRMYNWALDSTEVVDLKNLGATGNADSLAVRALLDANGLYSKRVGGDASGGVAVFDSSRRVVELYLQEGGVTQITADIGQLAELRLLNCYGDRQLAFPLLSSVSSAIGNCTKLTQLLFNINNLATLPVQITALKNLTNLSLGDNQLCSLPDTIKNWATTYDPDWAGTQVCTGVRPDHTATSVVPFSIRQTAGQVLIARGTLMGVLDADIYTTRGKLVYSIQGCPGNEMIWQTGKAASGIYFVRVTSGAVSYVRRVVVVR